MNMMNWKKWILFTAMACIGIDIIAQEISHELFLMTPGNEPVRKELKMVGDKLVAEDNLPFDIEYKEVADANDKIISLKFTGNSSKAFFHYNIALNTGYNTDNADFYLPGFWYHKNMRSPEQAPSFKTSANWNFREDRLSAPLTAVFDNNSKTGVSVMRVINNWNVDALTTSMEGNVILSGMSSLGYMGFSNDDNKVCLTFGYPYEETPRRYIRKLTLAPPVRAFAEIDKGEVITLKWRIHNSKSDDFGEFVANSWEYCYDQLKPQRMKPLFQPQEVKARLSDYMREAFVGDYPIKFYSSTGINIFNCKNVPEMQLGFCGRVLLNAFNALEYGEAHNDAKLVDDANAVFDSFLQNGFSEAGFLVDFVNYATDGIPTPVHSIRQQSEGVYAVLLYLKYEKTKGRKHPLWEKKINTLLDLFVKLQNEDGSYPRKFIDDLSVIDESGGSTPSATVPLVMGYKYFGNRQYLKTAEKTIDYLDENIIRKSDYFSSTLDANCEDKEAAISAATATYYMALVSKGQKKLHYIDLCKKATYFALSWYYLWDVPFAKGQMLGELDFKTRGWGNVSVENNHVDVFAFELPTIAKWVGEQIGEKRFSEMRELIASSMCQLLPTNDRLCGIAKPGFNPEVVQHTTWDYGRNGKGFYNDIFAPGWTIASLWELYSPDRTLSFFGINMK